VTARRVGRCLGMRARVQRQGLVVLGVVAALLGSLLGALLGALLVASPAPGSAAATRGSLVVQVLSDRADLISGGDALVAVRLPAGVGPERVRVLLGDRDVTRRFAVREDGRFLGLVRGLRVGRNVLRASAPGVAGVGGDRAVIVNHPAGGPVFSGPQTEHYRCQESARDDSCNEPATYDFLYKSTDPTRTDLQPYDPDHPPSDVATTTTDQGVEVPFVVRRERASRTATATRSSRCTGPASRGARGPRRTSGTTSCWSPTVVAAAPPTPRAPRRSRTTPARSTASPWSPRAT